MKPFLKNGIVGTVQVKSVMKFIQDEIINIKLELHEEVEEEGITEKPESGRALVCRDR